MVYMRVKEVAIFMGPLELVQNCVGPNGSEWQFGKKGQHKVLQCFRGWGALWCCQDYLMRNKVTWVPQLPYLATGGSFWRLGNQLLGQLKLVHPG